MALKEGDLKNTMLKNISIDEFEPKTGEAADVMVIGLYLNETAPAKDYKPRKDIGVQKPRSQREQQPTGERGSASLSPREQQRKAREERLAAKSGGKNNKELTKAADKLLSKKSAKKVDPNYKPQKASGYSREERRQIRRQGEKLRRHLVKGINKPAKEYELR